jgi:hypothetical protein
MTMSREVVMYSLFQASNCALFLVELQAAMRNVQVICVQNRLICRPCLSVRSRRVQPWVRGCQTRSYYHGRG